MTTLTPAEAAGFLLSHDNYTILTHRRPDGDTVGCAAALCLALRGLGKSASVLNNPQNTERYAPFLQGLLTEEPRGCIVSVDVSSPVQLPMNYSSDVELCIDHHGSNKGFAARTCLEAEAGACAELIYKVLLELGAALTPEIATALYVGVSTDTGCFRFGNTTPQTLRTAACLIEAGADYKTINRNIFEIKSRGRFGLEGYLTANMELYAAGKICVCMLPQTVIDSLGANEDDADSIAGFTRTLEGVEIGALIRDLPGGQSKVSLRTDSRFWDASQICGLLGGGGHAAASGATLSCSMEEFRERLLEAIRTVTGLNTEKKS